MGHLAWSSCLKEQQQWNAFATSANEPVRSQFVHSSFALFPNAFVFVFVFVFVVVVQLLLLLLLFARRSPLPLAVVVRRA
jgi:hypothetical protein